MAIVLHRIDVDPEAGQLTLHIQFSAASPIETRRAGCEWDGKRFRPSPEDDLLERMRALETQDRLRPGAYVNELLCRAMDAVRADHPIAYPIAITGTWLKPARRSPWGTFKNKLRLLFSPQPQKL